MAGKTRVYIETGGKKTFASAADWPGWSRSGKDEHAAVEALRAYAPRYAGVAELAGVDFPSDGGELNVVERVTGSASTDFGVPGTPARNETDKGLSQAETKRLVTLLEACWKYLDQVRAKAPDELRKGPRGGGRDREKMYQHVLDAEVAYAAQVGLKLKQPDRKAFKQALLDPHPDTKWPVAYAIRRTAWHALDHAWEMEDRIPAGG